MDKIPPFYANALAGYAKRIAKRIKEFELTAEMLESRYIEVFGKEHFELYVSRELFDSALKSYFLEIHRYKHFHGMLEQGKIRHINFPKIYSFLGKWILKEKPITVISSNTVKMDKDKFKNLLSVSERINETFYLLWIGISQKSHFDTSVKLNPEEKTALVYNLKYRDYSTGMMELFWETRVQNSNVLGD